MHAEKELISSIQSQLGRFDLSKWRDDCIFRDLGDGRTLAYSIDRPERILFSDDRDRDFRQYGRWSAALVSNDVIACGIRPLGISFDIGMAEFGDENDLRSWIDGVKDVCVAYRMEYEGGNLSPSTGTTGICYGIASGESLLRRGGAHPGDIVLVTADIGFGWSARLWAEKFRAEPFPDEDMLRYKDFPHIPLDCFEEVWRLNAIHASMDLTDGLIEFGYEILEQSGLGVAFHAPEVWHEAVVATADRLGVPLTAMMFEPGYDTPFAHGWSVDPAHIRTIVDVLERYEWPYSIVGLVGDNASGGVSLEFGGRGEALALPRYWDDVLDGRGSVSKWEDTIVRLLVAD